MGSAIAFGLLLKNIGNKIYILDADRKRLAGELSDLRHSHYILNRNREFPFVMGLPKDLKKCDWIVFTAGYPRKSHKESVDDLYYKNKEILSHYTKRWIRKPKRVLLCTNPTERLAMEFNMIPISKKLDMARMITDRHNGSWVIERKGFTNWGCATEVITRLDRINKAWK